VLPSLSSDKVKLVSPKNTIMFSGWCGVGKRNYFTKMYLLPTTYFTKMYLLPTTAHFMMF